MDSSSLDTIRTIITNIINPEWILSHGGLLLVIIFVFMETGLFVGFFLPGDSLLFVTGMVLAGGGMTLAGIPTNVIEAILYISFAGITGNYVGYWFGYKSGAMLFKRKDTLLFKKKYLIQASEFYEKNGSSTILIARFLPIIRTFAPIIAGIVKMDKKKFWTYNIIGSVVWVLTMILLGYFLGRIFPNLNKHLDLIVISIIILSTAPIIIKVIKNRKKK